MGRARSSLLALGLALPSSLALVALSVSSCRLSSVDLSQCDYVVTRCRPVYSTWCDGYGCYPTYYEQCWQDCYIDPNEPAPPPPPPVDDPDAAPPSDAAAPLEDAGSPPASDGGDAGGALCSPCNSNDACGAGGLCIVRGGSGSLPGFCGRACTGAASTSDCPAGYECSAIGSSRQCLPASGSCL